MSGRGTRGFKPTHEKELIGIGRGRGREGRAVFPIWALNPVAVGSPLVEDCNIQTPGAGASTRTSTCDESQQPLKFQPAGMSDEDNDSDHDFAVMKNSLKSCSISGGSKRLLNSAAPKLPHLVTPTASCSVGTPAGISNKKKNSQMYWEQQKMLKREVGHVDRPQMSEDHQAYFQRHRQLNMGLTDHARIIASLMIEWSPNQPMMSINPRRVQMNLETPPIFIDTAEGVIRLAETLVNNTEFAFDLEGNIENSFLGMTCLMQISTWTEDFILDPFKTYPYIVKYLRPIFEDGGILRIIHGGMNDIPNMLRDFDTQIVGGLDTQQAIVVLQRNNSNLVSFKNAVLEHLGIEVDKRYQCADWRKRPLTEQMLNYARNDSHILLRLWNMLRRKLLREMGEDGLQEAFIRTTHQVLLKEVSKPKPKSAAQHLKESKLAGRLNPNCWEIFEVLYQWRERYAKIRDGKPIEFVSTAALISLANAPQPQTTADLIKIIGNRGSLPPLIDDQGHTLLKVLEDGHTFIARVNTMMCHNCLKMGHAAVHCPFPSNPDRRKKYREMTGTKDKYNSLQMDKWLERRKLRLEKQRKLIDQQLVLEPAGDEEQVQEEDDEWQ